MYIYINPYKMDPSANNIANSALELISSDVVVVAAGPHYKQ